MIQDSINRISYDGNGIATEFAYPFTIITISDIKVMIVDTDGTETVLTNDYYVDEVNSKVDYPGYPEGEEPLPENQPPILATGQKIVIYRELSVTQLTSLFDQYPFKTIEAMIDKTTILLQQLKDAQERALTLSVSTDTAVSLTLPAPSALKSFRWNASANKLELTADPATVLESVQGYTEQAEGYATSANEDAETATSQAAIAVAATELFTLATQAEAEAGTNNVHYMSALRTIQAITANIATQAQAEGGTDNTKLMTSLRTLQLLDSRPATSTSLGGVMAGVGLAITPEGLLSTASYPAWFTDRGDGSDGDYAPTASTTLAGGTYNFSSVNIPAGVTITLMGCVEIKCLGAFICAGIITANGGNGVSDTDDADRTWAGGGGCNGYLPNKGGDSGAAGSPGYGGGAGGASGGAYDASAVAGGSIKGSSLLDLLSPIVNNNYLILDKRIICGAGGGGGPGASNSSAGGGGGGGGASIYITAHSVNVLGAITANGGNGGNGYNSGTTGSRSGGGGGGGGGAVVIVADTISNTGTISANGGTGGTSSYGYAGVAGSNGIVYLKELGAA